MEFETAKTVAAFGGLGLGVLNLGISLYKDFFRKGNIKVEIEKSEIKWRSADAYDFLVSLNVFATGKDVYLKDVWIEHPTEVFGPSNLSSKLHANKVVKHLAQDVLALDTDEYETEVKRLFKESDYTRDLCISEGQRKTLTITDRFDSERLMDGWLEVPLTGWKLVIDYGTKTISIPFNFTNTKPSETHAFNEWHA
ncbi:hypothetical protein KV201_19055 [Shewanella sp. SR1]|uniref:hypothetical protein n=1 Tax=Shewanella sp. SR1 TaxID=2855505 RepID=UPI001CF4BAE1|nr:hypothetical protein [Shewanella sp. SR1]MCB2384260.1 hypothetical protein [Shewanella sp. SR1]